MNLSGEPLVGDHLVLFLLSYWNDSESSQLAPALFWVSEFITDSSLTEIPVIYSSIILVWTKSTMTNPIEAWNGIANALINCICNTLTF